VARFNPFPDAYAAGKKTGVVVFGLDETKRQMRMFAPDLLKEMNREIRSDILGPIVTRAKRLVPSEPPLPRWNKMAANPGSRPSYSPHGKRWETGRLEWSSGQVRRGIRVGAGVPRKRGDSFKGAWAILNADAAGAVFELMGSGKSRVNMVGAVRSRHGGPSRLIWRAWDQSGARLTVPKQVEDTIRLYQARFQERLDGNARGIR
jgi:hypothetical protein